MPRFAVFGAVVVLLLSGSPSAAVAQDGAAPADRDAILAQSRQLSEAYMAGDIPALVAVYAEDGIAAPGGTDFIQGPAALEALWALPEGRTILHHAATPSELVIDGDHAYDWGYYEGQAAQDGEPLDPFAGKYVIVWRREADGVWRIVMDMWNRRAAPDAP